MLNAGIYDGNYKGRGCSVVGVEVQSKSIAWDKKSDDEGAEEVKDTDPYGDTLDGTWK
jgi:hypothetical protein